MFTQAQTFLEDRELNNYFVVVVFLDSDIESQNFEKS